MALIKHKSRPDEVYEVYGTKEGDYNYSDYGGSWTETHTEFLIYSCNSWNWVKAINYEPVKS